MKLDWKQQNDYDILEILKACDGKTLLRLTETCKRFNELISSSAKLTKRIQFNMTRVTWDLNCRNTIEMTEIERKNYAGEISTPLAELRAILDSVISNQRKYGKLKIVRNILLSKDERNALLFDETNEERLDIFLAIVDAIGKTINECELEILRSSFFTRTLLAVQNVEKFFLNNCAYLNPADFRQLENQNFNFMAKVNHFKLFCRYHDGFSILKLFRECKDLESLEFRTHDITNADKQIIDNFIAQQNQLKSLKLDIAYYAPTSLNWPAFRFKLKSLELHKFYMPEFVPELFIQQDQLESFAIINSFCHCHINSAQQFCDAMKAILRLPKLKKLEVLVEHNEERCSELPECFFSDLYNNTIEELNIVLCGNFIRIANSLQAVKKIRYREVEIDLSALRLDVIAKVHFSSNGNIIYSPPEVPPDREELESAFTKLFCNRKRSDPIKQIHFGHPDWLRHHQEFQLTFGFCKHLIEKSPQLRSLVLFNVHDCYDELRAYLIDNKPASLIEIKLNDEELEVL